MSQTDRVSLFLLIFHRWYESDHRWEGQGKLAPLWRARLDLAWQGLTPQEQEEARAVLLATGWRVPLPYHQAPPAGPGPEKGR
jgi:hypothetical protein